MKLKLSTLAFLLLIPLITFTQENEYRKVSPNATFMNALSMLDVQNYDEAVRLFSELLEIDSTNANINYHIGICYLNIPLMKDKSIYFLKKAIKNISERSEPDLLSEDRAPVDAFYFLGRALHKNYKFDEAIELMDVFKLKYKIDNPEFLEDIAKLVDECYTAIDLMKYPVEMEVSSLGKVVNTPYSEHSPVLSADETVLIFTSKREGGTGEELMEDGEFCEDIYISVKEDDKWSVPKSIGKNINTVTNEATIGLSADGQQLLIYRDDNGDGNIYISNLEGDSWSAPKKMGSNINTKYLEKHASLSADGKTIYFTSARPGGLGELDIYIVRKLPNGEWGQARNLGPEVNTKYNEEGPYIHPDGVTLFFSSEGHKTMGGYDIFVTTYYEDTRTWEEPTNMGYPINTTDDDVYYIPTVDGKRAYYSSCKEDGCGDDDLYMISLPGAEGKSLTVYTGIITMYDGTPPQEGYITVVDKETDEDYGVYTPNTKTGKYLFILPVGKEFSILYETENNLSHKTEINVEPGTSYEKSKKAIHLPPVVLGGDVVQGEYILPFEDGSYNINNSTENQLSDLAAYLIAKQEFIAKLEIEGNAPFEKLNKMREFVICENLNKKGVEKDRTSSSFTKDIPDKPVKVKIVANDTKDLKEREKIDDIALDSRDAKSLNEASADRLIVKDIFYDLDKFKTEEFHENMEELAKYMKKNKEAVIKLEGHCDDQGSHEYNIDLSIKRAQFVKDFLVKRGAIAGNIQTAGKGESEPIAINDSKESRKYNRRVEIYVIKHGKPKLYVEHGKIPDAFKLK